MLAKGVDVLATCAEINKSLLDAFGDNLPQEIVKKLKDEIEESKIKLRNGIYKSKKSRKI